MLRMFDSEYIVKFLGCYESKDEFIILQESVEGGNLYNYIKQKKILTEMEAARCIYDVLKGLEYLKGLGVIHRDIKLKNILLSQSKHGDKFKLCDFGLSDFEKRVDDSPETGTPGYIAPEIFLFKIHINGDIFSVGIILFALLTGYFPYNNKTKNMKEILMKNKKA